MTKEHMRVFREAVNALPGNLLLLICIFNHLFHSRLLQGQFGMAQHAFRNRRNAGFGSNVGAAVAVNTGQAQLHVRVVGEFYRLAGEDRGAKTQQPYNKRGKKCSNWEYSGESAFAAPGPQHLPSLVAIRMMPGIRDSLSQAACTLPIEWIVLQEVFVERLTGVAPVLLLMLAGGVCPAEEGMWTFDNPPTKQLEQTYNFTPTQQWLDHVRLSSVRLNDGGSGSFVSPHGLLLTNHHVARGQLQKNSTPEHDYIRDGFYAQTADQEMKSPDLEVNVLVSMENLTSRVLGSMNQHMNEKEAFGARKAIIAQIERESTEKTGLRSYVVTLYQGGEYWLYRYQKYTDVRLVFAPEQQTAFFGGDPDNFTYPRYDLDMAIFRVHENGKPINSDNYLKWNSKGAGENELVFVSGNPGSTQRLDTMSQLLEERDAVEPNVLNWLKHRIDVLKSYSSRGPEQAREAASLIFGLENGRKLYEGRYDGLLNDKLIAKKQSEENEFRARVNANPEWKQAFGDGWDEIAQASAKSVTRIKEQFYMGPDSSLAQMALQIVRYAAEIKKPDGERLPGYHESQLESLRYGLLSPAPVYPEMEIARLTGSLELGQRELGPDNAGLKAILDGRSPGEAARALVEGTKLADPAVRKQLLEGGQAAVETSNDTMLVMARRFDPVGRELIKWTEDNVQSVEQRAGEKLGKARFLVYGKTRYPDATFTLPSLTAPSKAIR